MKDTEQMEKVMAFCPAEVVYGGKKILATTCWEWVSEKNKAFKQKGLKNTNKIMSVWDLNNKKVVQIEKVKIESYSVSNYHGQMYLK